MLIFRSPCSLTLRVENPKVEAKLVQWARRSNVELAVASPTQLAPVQVRHLRRELDKELPALIKTLPAHRKGMPQISFADPTVEDTSWGAFCSLRSFTDRGGFKRDIVVDAVDLWRAAWMCSHFSQSMTVSPEEDPSLEEEPPPESRPKQRRSERIRTGVLMALLKIGPLGRGDLSDLLSDDFRVGWYRAPSESLAYVIAERVKTPSDVIHELEREGLIRAFDGAWCPTPEGVAYLRAREAAR